MTESAFNKAVKILKAGGVVAFPTETVFGIGALISKPDAVKRIFKIKRRPKTKPLQILVSNLRQAKALGKFNPQALELAREEWPGPLTLVVFKTGKVSRLITGGSHTVGLRMPDHKTALKLIEACGPLAATSANRSGEKPALAAKAAREKVPEVDFILAGKVKSGRPSKVIDATGKLKSLRK